MVMSVFAKEMTDLFNSPKYLSKTGPIGYLFRTYAETSLKKDLMRRTGASKIIVGKGYARITVDSPVPPTRYFHEILHRARSNDNSVRISYPHNGFVINNIHGAPEFVSVLGISTFGGRKTNFDYSLNCLDGECYRDIVDRIARKIGLVNVSADSV
jgi:hypothetical protein